MNIVEKEFNPKELEILGDVIYHATGGLGLGSWTWGENAQKVPLKTNPYQIIKDKFFSYLVGNKISAPREIWLDFLEAYTTARQKIGEDEMQTLTGYEWSETEALEKEMLNAIRESE